tara:strand:- start:154 stop:330 length:177 start_codon:yes stop_codon:yes gene_type:complete
MQLHYPDKDIKVIKNSVISTNIFLLKDFFKERSIEKLPWKVLFVVYYNFANGKASKKI